MLHLDPMGLHALHAILQIFGQWQGPREHPTILTIDILSLSVLVHSPSSLGHDTCQVVVLVALRDLVDLEGLPLIEYTIDRTNLQSLQQGDELEVELDLRAKYDRLAASRDIVGELVWPDGLDRL